MEWIALVALVAALLGTLVWGLGPFGRLPGVALAGAIAERIVCAVGLGEACEPDPLGAAYGPEIAGMLRKHAPTIRYEPGMRALPVDYRQCRSDRCAEGAESGLIWRTRSGLPVVAFTRVVDCRAAADRALADSSGSTPASGSTDCAGSRWDATYLQYWFYYPGSATGEGSIPAVKDGIRWASSRLGTPTYHRDDWESFQVRIGRDGEALARASSHKGHVYRGGVPAIAERASGRPGRASRRGGGWGPSTGVLYVSGGSHAGRIWTAERAQRLTPGARLTMIPLESLKERAAASFAVTPPWLKELWRDPEAVGTE